MHTVSVSEGDDAVAPGSHPGDILIRNFLQPMGLTMQDLARDTGIDFCQVEQIVRGERRITYATALRLCGYLGTTLEYWLDLQKRYDKAQLRGAISTERPYPSLPCAGIGPGMRADSVRAFFDSLVQRSIMDALAGTATDRKSMDKVA